jgi:predicted nucleic acid-binding protein
VIVLDASAAVDFLLRDETNFDWIEARLLEGGRPAAPHLLDSEVAHVLRKHVLGGRLDEGRAADALRDLMELPLDRYQARPLLQRIWELRHDLSGYDATYVALAETLDASLITSERRLLDLPAAASAAVIESRTGRRVGASQ